MTQMSLAELFSAVGALAARYDPPLPYHVHVGAWNHQDPDRRSPGAEWSVWLAEPVSKSTGDWPTPEEALQAVYHLLPPPPGPVEAPEAVAAVVVGDVGAVEAREGEAHA